MIYQVVHILFSKNIRYKTPWLRLDLCESSDVHIVVKRIGDYLAAAANENDKAEKKLH